MPQAARGAGTPLNYHLRRDISDDADISTNSAFGRQHNSRSTISPARRVQPDSRQAHGPAALMKRSAAPPPRVQQAVSLQGSLVHGTMRQQTPSPSRRSGPHIPCQVMSGQSTGSSPSQMRGKGSLPQAQPPSLLAVSSSSAVERFHMAVAGSQCVPGTQQMRGRVAVSASPQRHPQRRVHCGTSCEPSCSLSPRANLDAMSNKTPRNTFLRVSPRAVESIGISAAGVQQRAQTPARIMSPRRETSNRVAVSASPQQHHQRRVHCGASCEPSCSLSPRADLDAMSNKTPRNTFLRVSPRAVESIGLSAAGVQQRAQTPARIVSPRKETSNHISEVVAMTTCVPQRAPGPSRSISPQRERTGLSSGGTKHAINLNTISTQGMSLTAGIDQRPLLSARNASPPSWRYASPRIVDPTPAHNMSQPSLYPAPAQQVDASYKAANGQHTGPSPVSFQSHIPVRKAIATNQAIDLNGTDSSQLDVTSLDETIPPDSGSPRTETIPPDSESPRTVPQSPNSIPAEANNLPKVPSLSLLSGPSAIAKSKCPREALEIFQGALSRMKAMEISETQDTDPLSGGREEESTVLQPARSSAFLTPARSYDFKGSRNASGLYSCASSPVSDAPPPESARLHASGSGALLTGTPLMGSPAPSSVPEDPAGSCFVSVPLLSSPSSLPGEHGVSRWQRSSPAMASPCWMELLDPNGNVDGIRACQEVPMGSSISEQSPEKSFLKSAVKSAEEVSGSSSSYLSSGSLVARLEASASRQSQTPPLGSSRLENLDLMSGLASGRPDVSKSKSRGHSSDSLVTVNGLEPSPLESRKLETSDVSFEGIPPSRELGLEVSFSRGSGHAFSGSVLKDEILGPGHSTDNEAPSMGQQHTAASNPSSSDDVPLTPARSLARGEEQDSVGSFNLEPLSSSPPPPPTYPPPAAATPAFETQSQNSSQGEGCTVRESRELQLWAQAQVLEQECKQLGIQLANAQPGSGTEEAAARALLAAHAAFCRLDLGLKAHTEGRSYKVERLTKELRTALDAVARAAAPVFKQSENLVDASGESIDYAHLFDFSFLIDGAAAGANPSDSGRTRED